MKHIYNFLSLMLLFSYGIAYSNVCSNSVATYFSGRSFSVNLPRRIAGAIDYPQYDEPTFNARLSFAPGYAKSFRDDEITECLFGTNITQCGKCPEIRISGSRIENRGENDWLADYFGLATDYDGSIQFKPNVSNFFIDFSCYIGLDEWVEGLWFQAWAPFVHTKWDLDFTEICAGTANDHDAGYFTDSVVQNRSLLSRATDFFQRGKAPILRNSEDLNQLPVAFEPLKSCRWGDSNCNTYMKKNGIADIRMELGWKFARGENYYIGVGVIGAAPTGTRPQGCNLFEPVIGNGHHGEAGATITMFRHFWQSEDEDGQLCGQLDVNITHMIKAKQMRCFDLCNKPLSRYMLAEKVNAPTASNLWGNAESGDQGNSSQPSAQFNNAYTPVANLTCANVDVSVSVQVDLVAALSYKNHNKSLDVGYNFWHRSCEKIKLDCDCLPRIATESNVWALKGDAYVYGFSGAIPIALSATQTNNATINKGTNGLILDPNADNINNPNRNPGIDNPNFARTTQGTGANNNIVYTPSATNANDQTRTSIEPILLNDCHLNIHGARTLGQTHSFFAHVNYTWECEESDRCKPYTGFGAQVEIANNGSSDDSDCKVCCLIDNQLANKKANCNSCCESCSRCALSQWSIWFKGGVSFN